MAFSNQRAVSDGSLQTIILSIEFFDKSEIHVYVDDVEKFVDIDFIWATSNSIQFPASLLNGATLIIRRVTDISEMRHIFTAGAQFTNQTLDEDYKQVLHIAQESVEGSYTTELFNDLDMHQYHVRNMGRAELDSDAVPLAQVKEIITASPDLQRAVRAPSYEGPIYELPPVAARAMKVMGFDAAGNPVGVLPATGSATELALDLATDTVLGKGADMVGYTYGTAHSEGREVGDRLRETRSILDFVPRAQKAAIKAGTSTWAATDAINYALQETAGGILIPAGCQLSIDGSILLQRSNELVGGGPFDTTAGKGSKIRLLDGSNCEIFKTPYAVNPGADQTHFIGIRDLVLDGNKAGQTAEVLDGVGKFWGMWVGSWIKRVLLLNTYGPSLDFRGGCDVEVDHLWVIGCATATGYAVDTNADLSGSTLGGLLQFSNLYVENTSIDKNRNAKTEEAYRGKNIRLRRLVSAHIVDIHTEGAANAIDLDQNHLVRIDKITGYNIGSTNTAESALVRHVGGMTRATTIGTMFFANSTNNPYMVRKAAGLASNNAVPEVKFQSNPYVTGYTALSDNLFAHSKQAKAAYANQVAVERLGGFSEVSVNLNWGDADDAATPRSRFVERSLGPVISTNLNQPAGVYKDMLIFRSSGGSADSVTVSDPIRVGSRSTAAGISAGMVYQGVALPGVGNGPVWQRITGSASGADGVATVMRGVGAPATGADYIGQIYVDTSSAPPKKVYFGTNNAGVVSDWSLLN